MNYKIKELSNNIKLAYNKMEARESVVIGVWVKTGSRYETEDISGISHFLEHLVFKGTKNYTDSQIKQYIEGSGGALNAFTGEEFTCYYIKVREKHIELAFKILSDMVIHPNLTKEDIDFERKVILEEIKMYMDVPMRHVHNILDSLIWQGHSLGRMISGTFETVKGITRQNILDYKRQYYSCSNMAVVVCGTFDSDSLITLINKYFSDTPSGKKYQLEGFNTNQNVPQIKILDKPTQQTHFALGCRALYRDHPLHAVLSLLSVIMGGNMSSRLFDQIREKKGLAYDIGSRVIKHTDSGALVIYAGIEHKNMLEVLKIIISEFKNIIKTPPSEEELSRAREYYKGQLLLMLENTSENMAWFGEQVITDSSLISPEDMIKAADNVSSRQISDLAGEIIKYGNINFAAIGNKISGFKNQIKDIFKQLKD